MGGKGEVRGGEKKPDRQLIALLPKLEWTGKVNVSLGKNLGKNANRIGKTRKRHGWRSLESLPRRTVRVAP